MQLRRAIVRGVLVVGLLAATAGGCSKDNTINQDNSVTNNTVNNITQVLGPAGGEVVHPSGARIGVPAGALAADTELSIGELPPANLEFPLPSGTQAVSTIFGFQPHGQLFALDARISLPYSWAAPSAVRLLRASPGSDWQEVSMTDITPSSVVRDTATFSFYVAVVDGDGGSGGSTGGSGGSTGGSGGSTGGSGGSTGGVGGTTGGSGGSGTWDAGGCIGGDGPCSGAADPNCCAGPGACQFVVSEFLCVGGVDPG